MARKTTIELSESEYRDLEAILILANSYYTDAIIDAGDDHEVRNFFKKRRKDIQNLRNSIVKQMYNRLN